MKIITIVATRNRINFLAKSLQSIEKQIIKPSEIIVTSDSDEKYQKEEDELCKLYHATLIHNSLSKNYAGNLNSAITYLINHSLSNISILDEIYVAFLDDDDTWDPSYLKVCNDAINFHPFDFVATGFIYHKDEEDEKIIASYPLSIHDFLKRNPGIQGSNTFIKLTCLLKAGCFDEHLGATTDRDLFTRVMMLHPDYHIINQYLVNVNATSDHERLTTSLTIKQQSLAIFFNKYARLMNEAERKALKTRCKNLFATDFYQNNVDEIEANFNQELVTKSQSIVQNAINLNDIIIKSELPTLWICVIAGNPNQLNSIINQFKLLDYPVKKLLFFTNWMTNEKEHKMISKLLAPINNDYAWIQLNEVINKLKKNCFFKQWITLSGYYQLDLENTTKINCIALSRMILNYYAYQLVKKSDVLWIIDDDMQFNQLTYSEHHFVEVPLEIKKIISYYSSQNYDAVIGSYSNLPPLPFLSTLRTKLIDLLYCKYADTKDHSLVSIPNYYYDLYESSHVHWEWMLPTKRIHSHLHSEIKEIFREVRVSRKLFNPFPWLLINYEAINRGGNTLIFNKEILKVPNVSFNLNDFLGRRSDYFFVLNAKSKGFKIIASSFSLNHTNRNGTYWFDFKKELQKFACDLVGYSFTKAYQYLINNQLEVNFKKDDWSNVFIKQYQQAFTNRLSLFVLNYYRIQGILEILEDINYLPDFNENNLSKFVHDLMNVIKPIYLHSSMLQFFRKLHVEDKLADVNSYKQIIANAIRLHLDAFVGAGCEGIIFRHDCWCYKYFYHQVLLDEVLNKINKLSVECKQLIPITIDKIDNHYLIKHPYVQANVIKSESATRNFQIINLQNCLLANKILIQDLKKENFIITTNKKLPVDQLKLIDYGQNIKSITNEQDEISLIKGYYRLAKYWNLTNQQYSQLLYLNYHEDSTGIYYDLAKWKWLSTFHSKEQIHDAIIYSLINELKWTNLLDYGAGKCKIANHLKALNPSQNVFVYDLDDLTLVNRKANDVLIYHLNENNLAPTFDLINCNKVLCGTNTLIDQEIINNIWGLLTKNGNLILSICNPFFDGKFNTQLVNKGNFDNDDYYQKIFLFSKHTIYGDCDEYHKPYLYYERLLTKNNFLVDQIKQDETVSYNLEDISDHLYFCCHKTIKNQLDNCTLLIKTNPMDHVIIVPSILHIVRQLTKTDVFKEIIVIVDDIDHQKNRVFANDDLNDLTNKLCYLKDCLYIDKVYYASKYLDLQPSIYEKYFNTKCNNCQSSNKQQLFASLLGFELVKTQYVLQTDCDILYFNNGKQTIKDALNILIKEQALTLAFSIYHAENKEFNVGNRIEVRTCFLDLQLLNSLLPLNNLIINDQFNLAWHQALDLKSNKFKSIRLYSKDLWFVHPENELKKNKLNYIGYVSQYLEHNILPSTFQLDQVNLVSVPNFTDLFPSLKTSSKMVIYSRGYNVPIWKTWRWLKSLKNQSMQDFQVVYIDDKSDLNKHEYLQMLFTYDEWCKKHVISLFNWKNVRELSNFYFAINQLMSGDNSIVVNVDGDDALLTNEALKIIKKHFDEGADVSVGNCFNVLKPTRIYDHVDFIKPWLRAGDNIWLHPKCFLLKLAKQIKQSDLMNNQHHYYEYDTDFAIMYAILRNASHPVFIKDLIYLYDPAIYSEKTIQLINKIRNELAIKARQDYLTKE